ncbi:glycosyltransferase family 2 protein [Paenibacillus sp. WLX2291]|uniref:glycosyltransferase family 2 protein n=1 Tax=Paenibacillus sp. WLX2291 TaxID=3296934 RepID=UPI003984524C
MISRLKKVSFMAWDEITGWASPQKKIILVPLNDVIKNKDNNWEVMGSDPSFVLEGSFRKGWIEFAWESGTQESIPLKFYIDYGHGFSEEHTITPSYMPKGTYKGKVLFFIPYNTKVLRLDTGDKKVIFKLQNVQIKKITRMHMLLERLQEYRSRTEQGSIMGICKKVILLVKKEGIRSFLQRVKSKSNTPQSYDEYTIWQTNNQLTADDLDYIYHDIQAMQYQPLISFVLPVYNVDEIWLRRCIDSVIRQYYTNWELCIADDASTKDHIKRVLDEYSNKYSRIKVVYREKNGHISEASNSALALVTGEYLALLDHDDEIANNALYEIVKLLNHNKQLDIIYSDEDFVNMDHQRVSPFFKPDWSPDRFLCHMYYGHLGVYRSTLIQEAGGFRKGYEGSQDFDLALRITEKTQRIAHIPKILYHWRMIPESTASNSSAKSYTHVAGMKALSDAMRRREINGWIEELSQYPNYYLLHYNVHSNPLVSIIVTENQNPIATDEFLEHLLDQTAYINYEIVVIWNADEVSVSEIDKKWNDRLGNRYTSINAEKFQGAHMYNKAVSLCAGEHYLFINHSIRLNNSAWLQDMIGHSQRKETAVIGAYIQSDNDLIIHSGYVLGLGEHHIAEDPYKGISIDFPGHYGAMFVTRNVSALSKDFFIISKEIFVKLEGFDMNLQEHFFEIDFALKAMQAGYINVWLPYVRVILLNNISNVHDDSSEERAYMKGKWNGFLKQDAYYNENYSKDKPYMLDI